VACGDDAAWDAGGNRMAYVVEALVSKSQVLEQLRLHEAVVSVRDQ
jgi:hypothetical protein